MVAGRRDSQTDAMVDSPTSGCHRRGPAQADKATAPSTPQLQLQSYEQKNQNTHTNCLPSVQTYSLYTSGQKSLPYYIYIDIICSGNLGEKISTNTIRRVYICRSKKKKKWNLISDVTTQCLHLKTTASIPALDFLHTRYSLHGCMEGPPAVTKRTVEQR